MRASGPFLLALAALVLPGVAISEADAAHPVVPGFERSFAGGKGDQARGGELLLGELSCVSCHAAQEGGVGRKQAPVLDQVGSRVRVGHLRKFLSDPRAVKPGTTMPDLLHGDPEKGQKVEALVHFLASTGSTTKDRPSLKGIATGRDLYHKLGCFACHGSRDDRGKPDKVPASSVPLGPLEEKYTVASLTGFLEDPHAVRPSGRMPKLLRGQEARDVASYLLQGIQVDLASVKGASRYTYYEGSWDRVPDFTKLRPVASGLTAGFDLGVARRDSNYAMRMEGYLQLPAEASYTFFLSSDDGALLHVDDRLVVDNDGVHPVQTRSGSVRLTPGIHKVAVAFFQAGGGAELKVEVGIPGLPRVRLDTLVAPSAEVFTRKPEARPEKDEDFIEVQPALTQKGRELFASLGCASCHALSVGKERVASTLKAKELASLAGAEGCLSATPPRGVPAYGLSQKQREALAAVLGNRPAPAAKPAEVIARGMLTFGCYACHTRSKVGGPPDELNTLFQTTQPEMGDEGRLPPPLDGVGAKLQADYLRRVLADGADDRPYMHARMPGFGAAATGPLAAALLAEDHLPEAAALTSKEPELRLKAVGRHLAGGQAFGCIKCHTFNGQKAEGVQGIDMVLMPRRLTRDWFHAYVSDPQKVRPGTRMPAAFIAGKSVLPDVLDGTANTQIESMWLYLLDGPRAQLPVGMRKEFLPLVPETGAIIYRNFIEGAGPRAVAVGYPEKAHLAFDANEMRLALLWQGAFLDASRHWTDRGVGYEAPLGDNLLRLHGGAPFATLDSPEAPWPAGPVKAQGYRFKGYRLTSDDRPTFLYAMNGVEVADFPTAVAGKYPSLRRTLTLSAARPAGKLYFRAAAAGKVEPQGQGWYQIDGAWKLKIDSDAPPVLRQSGTRTELLVPLTFKDGKAQLTEEFVW